MGPRVISISPTDLSNQADVSVGVHLRKEWQKTMAERLPAMRSLLSLLRGSCSPEASISHLFPWEREQPRHSERYLIQDSTQSSCFVLQVLWSPSGKSPLLTPQPPLATALSFSLIPGPNPCKEQILKLPLIGHGPFPHQPPLIDFLQSLSLNLLRSSSLVTSTWPNLWDPFLVWFYLTFLHCRWPFLFKTLFCWPPWMPRPPRFFFHIWLLDLGLFCCHDFPSSNFRRLKDNCYEHLSSLSLYLPDLIHSPGFKCVLDAGNFQIYISNANHTLELQSFILNCLLDISIRIYDLLGLTCLRLSSDILPNWLLFQSTSSQ